MQRYHVNLWEGDLEEGVKRNKLSLRGLPGFAHVWAFLVVREREGIKAIWLWRSEER